MALYSEDIARICHEANRALQQINGDPHPSPPWDDAPDWQKQSAINGVLSAVDGTSPQRMHELWCQHKYDEGWTLGAVKDEGLRTHPCLVPYDELPAAERIKDHLFIAIVTAMSKVR